MPITFTVDHAQGIVISRYAGHVTADDLTDHFRAMIADPDALGTGRSLADLTALEQMCGPDDLAIAIERIVEPDVRTRGWRLALVVTTPEQFVAARQIQMFSGHTEAAIFAAAAAATTWLCATAADEQRRAA